MELSALDTGKGPAAVLLHGQPGGGADWSPVTERLRERLRVIAPDRPGYGRTGGRAVGFRENAAAVVALLDRLEVDAAVIAGHSWGAGAALAAAVHFPRRVRALVLVAPVAPGVPPGLGDRLLAHPLVGPAAARLGIGLAGLGLALAPVRRLARATVPAVHPDQVATTLARWRAEGVWRSFYAEQRAFVEELPSLGPRLGSVRAPATVLSGAHDHVAPPSHARALAESLPDARLVTAEGAGHLLPQQRPELVAEAIAAAAGRRG